ncbi:MAG: hypothetical protein OXU48_00440 [candidate division Zixibacteria bacterium]|nr:hypothetical protein [candidate division Zixibacteria bacterium]
MRRLFFLLAMPCMLAMPFLTAGKANAQVSLEIQGHSSIALEDLGFLVDGTGFGGLAAVAYPLVSLDMVDLVGKAGFNHYGTRKGELLIEGDIVIDIDSAYQGIPILGGVRVYYGESRFFYIEGLLGVEIKRREDFDNYDLMVKSYATDPLGSIGVGINAWRDFALVASFGMSNDLWRYVNLGVSYRFGG